MYMGSVRFFKRLIVITVALMIILPAIGCVYLTVQNSTLQAQIDEFILDPTVPTDNNGNGNGNGNGYNNGIETDPSGNEAEPTYNDDANITDPNGELPGDGVYVEGEVFIK